MYKLTCLFSSSKLPKLNKFIAIAFIMFLFNPISFVYFVKSFKQSYPERFTEFIENIYIKGEYDK